MDMHRAANRDHLVTVVRFAERQWRRPPVAAVPRVPKDAVDPRAALAAAALSRGDSLAALSRMIGRGDRYLDTFVRDGHPRALRIEEHESLCAYFGKPIGIRDLWQDRA